MKIYRAKMGSVVAYVEEHVGGRLVKQTFLDPALHIVNHSPTGFSWGYAGSGPSQFAAAILFDFYRDRNRVIRMYQRFKCEKIATVPRGGDFVITEPEIVEWARAFEELVGNG